MNESEIEQYLVKTVRAMDGEAYKFNSLSHRGVSDRIVCLPNGETWFIELKTSGGKLSALQKVFAQDMKDRKSTRLNSSHIPLSRMPSSA